MFYVVATPIGNLKDISQRALDTLSEVDFVLCEDTRNTRKLLSHFGINTKTLSFHAHSTAGEIERILGMLRDGKNLALVSDAGTPAISDPGSLLVRKIRENLPEVQVVSIPGASAVITALSAIGVPSSEFTFLGFVPHKKGRETFFKKISEIEMTVVFYESKHRILKTLESLEKYLPNRRVAVARELTKIFEEIIEGSASQIKEKLLSDENKQKGEFTVVVFPSTFQV